MSMAVLALVAGVVTQLWCGVGANGDPKQYWVSSMCNEPPPGESGFSSSHWWMVGIVIIVIAVFVCLAGYEVWWRKNSEGVAKHSEVMEQVETFEVALVQNLTPSMTVDKHRFRGITPRSNPIGLKFSELGLSLKDGTCILQSVTGGFDAGHMAAIMGPSGAGKTTFMNVLCGKATYGKMEGKVYINDQEADIKSIKSQMGFVPQDDVVHESLTVRENFSYAARLRNRAKTSDSQIRDIVDDVISIMQVGHIQRSLVGGVESRGISGGQRKRVNIGIELAACPTLLFLDEPTSGLDSTSSLQVIHSLQRMTDLNMTIIMVIHQPRYNLFTLFDDALLLGKGGSTVYLGPSTGAKPYFESLGFEMPENDNPADWFMDVVSGEVANPKIENFRPSMLFDAWEKNKGTVRTAGGDGQRWTATSAYDLAVLNNQLNEAWDKVDQDGSSTLGEDELREVLKACTGIEPTEKVVEEMMIRMGGADCAEVSKHDFTSFLIGLQGVVAQDQAIERYAHSSDEEEDESSVFDTMSVALIASGKSKSSRPNCFPQFRTLCGRTIIQAFRSTESQRRTMCLFLLMTFAIIVGLIGQMGLGMNASSHSFSPNTLMLQLPLSMIVLIAILPIFQDRPIFWRECSSGLSIVAYFFSRLFIKWVDVALFVVLYASIFTLIADPENLHFTDILYPCFLLAFASSGWGCVISTCVTPANSTLCGVVLLLCINMIFGTAELLSDFLPNPVLNFLCGFSGTRWTVPMIVLTAAPAALDVQTSNNGTCISLTTNIHMELYKEYTTIFGMQYWNSAVCVMCMQGFVLHILALICLNFVNREKMV